MTGFPARTGARSDTGRVRERNEDRYLVREARGVTLLAVADGVGGEAGGEVASDAAVEALASRFFAAVSEQGPRDALAAAVREANDAVMREGERRGKPTAASTLVAAAVRGREAAIANLGDSRAYLVRDGRARQLTTDHAGPRTNEITRFVGDPRGVQPDVFVESLRRGDRLLLCSDGLTKHVPDDELAARVGGADPANAAQALVSLANERGGEDNVTVVIYRPAAVTPLVAAMGTAVLLLLVALGVVGAAAAVMFTPTPAPVPTPAPSAPPSPSPSPTASPTASPAPSPTASPTSTP